ncbi:MAG: PA2779 family protein [bacterium]|nr:PA2779 family protein [bacterium]MDT8365331.1 PA2779 family protein [bacterium]
MRKMLRYPAVRLICWYLAFTLSGLFILPAAAQAAFISPSEETLAGMDVDTLATVREVLETGILTEKLASLGLSSDEIRTRLDGLTPEERQAVMEDLDQIQAGGNGVVTLLVVILLVIVILKLMDKEITIK